MFLIHNERTKLTANWLNTLATALIAAGTFAPLLALLYGYSGATVDRGFLAGSACICFAAGVALHWGGSAYLRRLRE
jgi:hypothetical protein